MVTTFLYFMSYAFLGWCCESLYKSIPKRKFINSGFLNGPLCPVYGFGALLILYVTLPYTAYLPLVFIVGMLATSLLEYITSWILEIIFHMSWWDYSHYKYNINGRVCLLNAVLFGILSIVVVYNIHPWMQTSLIKISSNAQIIIAFALFVLLSIDTIVTTYSLIKMNKTIRKIHEYLHSIFENPDALKQHFMEENEVIIERLLRKRENLIKSFPTYQHRRFDIKGKSINELMIKRKNKN